MLRGDDEVDVERCELCTLGVEMALEANKLGAEGGHEAEGEGGEPADEPSHFRHQAGDMSRRVGSKRSHPRGTRQSASM